MIQHGTEMAMKSIRLYKKEVPLLFLAMPIMGTVHKFK
jgi:hypothetical protein